MSARQSWRARKSRWNDRIQAWISGLTRPATAFVSQPEPRSVGSPSRGRLLLAGNFMFAGVLVEAPETGIWDLPSGDPDFDAALHGFAWLDDLASVGLRSAEEAGRNWTHDWIARYGRGKGPGWSADIAGRRLIRLVNHAPMILSGASQRQSKAYFRSLAHQVRFVSGRSGATTSGLPRFEALAGVIYAGLALQGLRRPVAPALKSLERECATFIDSDGGIPSRCPEELLEILTLLSWVCEALEGAQKLPGKALADSMQRIAPILRALRHSDGRLARFHGGDRGLEGRLDQALAACETKRIRMQGLAMGYARLRHGRTTLILDASAPPRDEASLNAHASTLAFELTSGRRPMVVNCGPGYSFGEKWRRAGRATASHSTLAIEGCSSSRLSHVTLKTGQLAEVLSEVPGDVRIERRDTELSSGILVGHDGYLSTHGLTHVRQIFMSVDGRGIQGEDVLATIDRSDEQRFDSVVDASGLSGIPFKIRFHLHPDADAELDLGGTAVSVVLKSGEVWIFRHTGAAQLMLEPSVYLEPGRLSPRPTRQIVLNSAAREYATRVSWSLAKAKETPDAMRDLVQDDALLPV